MGASGTIPHIRREERGGIPLLWIERDDEPRVALVFRVGMFDEPFSRGGITHLVEHLALHVVEDSGPTVNGFVGLDQCGFTARGTTEELVAFLHGVTAALSDLPLDRLGVERGVLEAEESASRPGIVMYLAQCRYGLAPAGRRMLPELGLRSVVAEDLVAWSARHFTKASAVICWLGPEPPPADLALALPAGTAPVVPPAPTPIVPLPFSVTGEEDDIAIALTAPSGMATHVFAEVLQRRLTHTLRTDRGIVYTVDSSLEALTGGVVHLTFSTEASGGMAASVRQTMLDELDRLADDGPSADDVAAAVREVERDFADANGSAFLIDAALALRTGQPIPQPADQHAELQGVDAAAVSQVAWHARETLMVMSPEMIAVPGPPFKSDGDVETHPPVEGRTFLSPGLRASKRSLLTIGDHGLTVRSPGQEDSLTLHWSDVVAVTRERGGDYYFTGISGAWCVVNPRIFRADADAIKALIEQYLDPATLVPAPGAEHIDALEEAAVRDLKKPKDHREALDALAEEMSPGERLHRLFSAITGMKYGLLAVTDRRTLFIYGDAPTDEIPHSLTKRIDVESAKMGQTVVVDSFPEPRRYWGFDHTDEPDALRDLLRQLQDN